MGKKHFGYLITVCADAEDKCPRIFPGVGKREHWPIDDPAAVEGRPEEILGAYRRARDEIGRRVQEWLAAHPAAA
jgi:arsenate reductase